VWFGDWSCYGLGAVNCFGRNDSGGAKQERSGRFAPLVNAGVLPLRLRSGSE
jgi:hypothetical protein